MLGAPAGGSLLPGRGGPFFERPFPVVRLRGLPYDAGELDVFDFFQARRRTPLCSRTRPGGSFTAARLARAGSQRARLADLTCLAAFLPRRVCTRWMSCWFAETAASLATRTYYSAPPCRRAAARGAARGSRPDVSPIDGLCAAEEPAEHGEALHRGLSL